MQRRLLFLILFGLSGLISVRGSDSKRNVSGQIPIWQKQFKVPAVGVAVIKEGRIEWAEVFGERELGVAATRDTIFNVASLTKPVFAMMALHIAARGDLDLDSSVSQYWIDPDLTGDERHKKLTPRIILSHQTGFPNWRRDKKLSFEFDPGTKYQYSGEGFEYLKRAIEKKEGKGIAELVDAAVFKPAGMDSTRFTWKEEIGKRFAIGYNRQGKAYTIPKRQEASAADDLLTTIDDYARFVVWVLKGADLPEALFQEMQREQVKQEGSFNFGLGWQLIPVRDLEGKILNHGGSDEGVRTETFMIPSRKEGIVILTNSDNSDPLIRLIVEGTLGSAVQHELDLALWRMLEQLPPQELAQGIPRLSEMPAVMDKVLHAIEARFLDASNLSPEEKAEGREAIRHFAAAMIGGMVGKEKIDTMTARIFTPVEGGMGVKKVINEDDLRELIRTAKLEADGNGTRRTNKIDAR